LFCTACEKQQFEDIKKSHSHVTDILVQPRYTLHNKDLVVQRCISLKIEIERKVI